MRSARLADRYKVVMPLVAMNVREGAQTTLTAATSATLNAASGGQYLEYCALASVGRAASAPGQGARLWDWSCEVVGLPRDWAAVPK